MEKDKAILCRRLERGQGRAIREKRTTWFACLFPQITTSRERISSAKFPVPANLSPACHMVLQPALRCTDSTWCRVTANQKNAKPKTCPQSHTQADSSRWQTLTHSDPLSKWQRGSRCFFKATVLLHTQLRSIQLLFIYFVVSSSVTRYSSETLPGHQLYGGSDVCGIMIYAEGKETPGIEAQKHRKQGTT